MSIFETTLRSAGLDQYTDNFNAFGIDSLQSLTLLTMQDYAMVGVSSMEDRKISGSTKIPVDSGSGLLAVEAEFMIAYAASQKRERSRESIAAPISWTVEVRSVISSEARSHIRSFRESIKTVEREFALYLNILKSHEPKVSSTSSIQSDDALKQAQRVPIQRSSSPARFSGVETQREGRRGLTTAEARISNPPPPSTTNTAAAGGVSRTLDPSDSEDETEAVKIKYSFSPNRNPKAPQPLLNVYGVPNSVSNATRTNQGGSSKISDISDRIRVCVRKRPLNRKELKSNQVDVANVLDRRTLVVNEPKVKVDLTKFVEQHEFTFDEVFDFDSTNDEVYKRSAFPLVEYIFSGGKATCFAYGQTGSGKTYTMLDETNGLYVKAGRDIFKLLEKPEYQHLAAYVGFYEIYQRQVNTTTNQLYDLLNGRKRLHAREDGKQNVVISGLQEYEINSVDKVVEIFNHGHNARSTGVTGANADSSRSHAIFQIVLKHRKSKKKVQGKLSFIDLAGSERGADRGDTDQRTRMEGSEINKSLLALKECIRALDQESKHTPFRQSKLTQVLKDSFIGYLELIAKGTFLKLINRNSRTCMIATISPSSGNSEHTLNTLRYAYRVKELKGDSQYQDVDAHDGLYDEPENDDFVSGDEDPFLDSEFPPENLLDSDDAGNDTEDDSDNNRRVESQIVQAPVPAMERSKNKSIPKHSSKLKPSMLVKPSTTSLRGSREALSESKSNLSHVNSSLSIGSKRLTSDLPAFEELVNFHRQHLRLFAELSKSESKLIVNYSIKGKSDSGGVSQDLYVAELSSILAQKEESISVLKGLLEQFAPKK
ncbi:Kinesin-like protein kif24 [Entophlyctis luteolus]|nr:Kinesin-like protein kif24 [Entophlyctis luteolus]